MAYTLITANRNYSSWSLRPWALMKALDIPFDDRIEPFLKPSNYEDFRAFSPTGQVPVLIDGERTVWDTLGIVMYLADRHKGVWPRDEAARAWAQCAVAEMHSGFAALRNACGMCVGIRIELKPMSDALKRDVDRIAELWAEGIARFGGPWLAGPAFSAVDAFFAPVAFRVRSYGLCVGNVGSAWVDQLLSHPAIRAWEAAALAETWRDGPHEADILASGTVVADYRAT